MAAFLCYYAKDETTVLVPMLQGKVEKEPLLENREGIFSAKKYLTLYNRRYILNLRKRGDPVGSM